MAEGMAPLLLGMIFLFTACGPLTLIAGETLDSVLEGREPVERVLVLMDSSYSMGYRFAESGESNEEAGLAGLDDFISRTEGRNWEWALADFSGRGSYRLVRDFEKNTEGVLRETKKIDPWGTSDIAGGMEAAKRTLEERGGGVCFVISDLVETSADLFSLTVMESGTVPPILWLIQKGADSPNDPLRERLEKWVELQGDVFFYNQGILDGGNPGFSGEAGPSSVSFPPAVSIPAENRTEHRPGHGPGREPGPASEFPETMEYRTLTLPFFQLHGKQVKPFVPGVAFFLMFLATMMLIVSFRMNYRRKQNVNPGIERRLHYFRRSGGEQLEEKILDFPGDSDKAVVVLPGDNRCEIFHEKDRLTIECERSILVDGVGGRRKKIKEGSILLVENHRFFIGKMEIRKINPEPRSLPLQNDVGYLVFLLSSGAALLLFTLASILLPFESETIEKTERGGRKVIVDVEAEATESAAPAVSEKAEEFKYVYEQGNPDRITKPQVMKLGREPGSKGWKELPRRGEIDVLFLHAHPDDEAIDFGGLLARLSQRGKKTGVVLFTDGESGLSRGPYTNKNLAPKVLSSIRVEEATASMGELGCSLYVRLGYRNHPYSSAAQVLSRDEVYRAWGGREGLRTQIAGLIERLGPEVVVSVDGDSRTLIHFEHEAVGAIVAEAVELLEKEKKSPLKGYLIAINPRDHREYSEACSIPVMESAGEARALPVAVQLRALKKHESQIDAGVVALEYMPFFDTTWVWKQFWNLDTEMEDFF